MNVLIACERSGVVREAFRAYSGINCFSCDLYPPEDGRFEHHIQGDAIQALRRREWDLVIAHPTCTYLANSGSLRLYRGGKKINGVDESRWYRMETAAKFFRLFFSEYGGYLCAENPVMHGHARKIIGLNSVERQHVQPHYFGDNASKETVLWLRGLPRLRWSEHDYCYPRYVCRNGHKTILYPDSEAWRVSGQVHCPMCHSKMLSRWENQTDSGQNRLPPSPTRQMDRSRTYPGLAAAMAAAMAAQWIPFLLSKKTAWAQ